MNCQQKNIIDENYVDELLFDMIDFLNKNKIITKRRIKEIKDVIKNVHISINDFEDEYIDYELFLDDGEYIELKLKNNNTSNITNLPPQIHESEILKIYPIMNLMRLSSCEELKKTIFHEASHLFSISDYAIKKSENKIELSYIGGIEEFYYEYFNFKQINFSKTDVMNLNEIFTDIVAEYLYNNILQKNYYYYYNQKKYNHNIESMKFIKKYLGDDIDLFVKNYFEFNLKGNLDFFKADFRNFEDLNVHILTNSIKNG